VHDREQSSRGAKEVPLVAVQILEDRDLTIGLGPWCRQEFDATLGHVLVRRKEIVDAQEESHATGELPPDQSHLLITSSLGEQDATAGAGRANNDPSLRLAVAVERWRIIFHDTAEHVHEELNRLVVLLTMTLTSSRPMGSDYFLEPSDPMVRSLSWRHEF